uniref:TSL-kinase interacting protein 1 n=2 Tax=Anthurium amnicola TaxID=1678845 RepID=A0A1D1YGQ5_9ARAE
MLFPYSAQQENIASCPRWTLKDTAASAGDVHASVGSPAIFRLRYGWFSKLELPSATGNIPSSAYHFSSCMHTENVEEDDVCICVPSDKSVNMDSAVGSSSPVRQLPDRVLDGVQSNLISVGTSVVPPVIDMQSKNNPVVSLQQVDSPRLREVVVDVDEQEDMENLRTSDGATMSACEWADSLTNISIGDLLSEASRAADPCHNNPSAWEGVSTLQHLSLSCDSFDAAIAGLLSHHQDVLNPSTRLSPASILDAEETCDEFSFHKVLALNQDNLDPPSNFSSGACGHLPQADGYPGFLKDFAAEIDPLSDLPREEDIKSNPPNDEMVPDNISDPAKNMELTDFCWPDSLGPLDLDIASTRYQGQDLLFESASLSGLSRLIASSLDAFQNCSFFCSDKKESLTSEVQDTPPFLDNKIGAEG